MKRQLYRQRKAVSPVIATVLMIMVTMVGMTILFAFVASYSDNYKEGIGSSVMESLVLEDVWVRSGTVEIWLFNCGKLPVNIQSIYVNGLSLDVTSFDGGSITNPLKIDQEIAVNGHAHIIANLGFSPNSFKISTERGSVFEYSYP